MTMEKGLYTPDCIRTVSGRYVNLIHPDPDTLHIEDIAHALSNIPRFGGHLPIFYSVAHHSVAVCEKLRSLSREERFQALMHDASEAYLLDIPAPLKAHLPEYRAIEARMMKALAQRFGFQWPMLANVHLADRAVLQEEWEEIMLADSKQLPYTNSPPYSAARFLTCFHELKPQAPHGNLHR